MKNIDVFMFTVEFGPVAMQYNQLFVFVVDYKAEKTFRLIYCQALME